MGLPDRATSGSRSDRLAATTYTTDDLAYDVWRDEIGLPPERLVRWGDFPTGDEKNWWRMADIGPCGPCSEIHFDRGAQFSEGPECVPDHSETLPALARDLEPRVHGVRAAPGSLADAAAGARAWTPGMGLERLASVLQQVPTNYDTDLFTPIHARMQELLGHDPDDFEQERFSYQVIADHSRAVTFLIGDDVLPGNEGRGYVLRRILRRAVRHGRLLGRREPFMAETAASRDRRHGRALPAPRSRSATEILATIAREEAQFARTLDAGSKLLDEAIRARRGGRAPERVIGRRPEDLPHDAPVLDGDVAFRLHDTYGFPVDLTVELAAEYGFKVDLAGFSDALAEQRERSRSGKKAELAKHAELSVAVQRDPGPRRRHRVPGLRDDDRRGPVVAIIRDGMEFDELTGNGEAEVVLDRTPFYAEGGGQVGDQGTIREPGGGSELFTVNDTQRPVGGPDRPSRHAPRAVARRRDGRRPSSTPSGAPTRCATTRARTCSTGRCATWSARRPARPARS